MKIYKIIICIAIITGSLQLLSDNINDNWRLNFFNEFINGYNTIKTPDHKSISKVLIKSFNSVKCIIPEKECDLKTKINAQIEYFSNLTDTKTIEYEVKKCTSGMKKANSFLAKLASEKTKANMFIKRFKEEYNSRITKEKKHIAAKNTNKKKNPSKNKAKSKKINKNKRKQSLIKSN